MARFLKISVSFLLVLSFLISTTGVVFYYHTCQASTQRYVSVYIDLTEELCHEQKHHDHHTCCSNENENNSTEGDTCCPEHQVQTLSYRLTENLLSSEEISILPIDLCFNILFYSSHKTELQELNAFNKSNAIPLSIFNLDGKKNYGRIVTIRQHNLKLYC
ncbi:MAG: hypothetical protein ACK5IJ_08065 [Mangrovibacterium sp.]